MAINRAKVLDSAQKYLAKGQLDRAIAEYQKLVDDDPRDVRTLLKVGDLYTRKGSRREACDAYKRVASHYAQEGFYLKAVAVYKQILKLDPSRIDVQLDLADMHIRLNMKGEAVSTLDSVARTYARDGDIARTLEVLRRMGQLEPESVPIRIRYAEALSQAGKKEDAADAFGVGAALLKQQGRMEDYIKVAERLLFHRPTDIPLSRELATLYLQRRDPKRALAKLQICFKSDPKNIHTLDLLAVAFEQLGQIPKTISVYKEMAKMLADNGENEQRATVLNRILELDPHDREARQALAAYAPSTRGSIAPAAPPPVGPEPPMGDNNPDHQSGASIMPRRDAWGAAPAEPYAPEDSAVSYVPKAASPASVRPPAMRPVSTPPSRDTSEIDDDELRVVDENDDSAIVMLDDADVVESDSAEHELPPVAARSATDTAEDSSPMVEIIGPNRGVPPRTSSTGSSPQLLGSRPASIPPNVAQKAQIARLLTECEVFERYGLRQKVIEQLNRVLVIDSRHVEARERLKETFLAVGRIPEAVEQLHALAEIVQSDADAADRYLSEAALLADDTSNAREEVLFVDDSQEVALEFPTGRPPDRNKKPDLEPISQAEFDAAPLHASPPGDESEARARSLKPSTLIEGALDEAEFFLQQGLLEEARVGLIDALEQFNGHPLLKEKLEEVAEAAAEAALSKPPPRASLPPGEDESFMLAAKLAEDLDQAAEAEDIGSDVIDVETVFAQFKKGIEATVSKDDSATHYDLGIAYMEMGLLDDAAHEFDLARTDPARECAAYTMIGTCQMRKNDPAEAVEAFKRGLAAGRRTEREELALWFELGQAYEALKNFKTALEYYNKVRHRDPSFREVERRIRAMESPGTATPGPAVPDQDEIDRAFDDLIAKE